jgi:hypothetical protein
MRKFLDEENSSRADVGYGFALQRGRSAVRVNDDAITCPWQVAPSCLLTVTGVEPDRISSVDSRVCRNLKAIFNISRGREDVCDN